MLPAVLPVPLEPRGTVPLAVTQAPRALFILLKCCSQEAGLCLRRLLFHVKSPGSRLNIDSCYCRNLEHDTDFFFSSLFWRQPLLGNPLGKHLSHPCPWVLGSGSGHRQSRGSGASLQATEANISWLDTQKGICWEGVGQHTGRGRAEDPGPRGLLRRTRRGGSERVASARSSTSWALGLGAGAQLMILASPLPCWRGTSQRPGAVLLQEGDGCGQANTRVATLCSDAVRLTFPVSPLRKYSTI